jgi:hypothetical protein
MTLPQLQFLNLPQIDQAIQQRKANEMQNALAPYLMQQKQMEVEQARRKMSDEGDMQAIYRSAGGDIGKAADALQQDPRFFAKGVDMRSKLDESAMRQKKMQAQERITAGYATDPNFKPNYGDLLALDPADAMKLISGAGINSGLEPKVGINPTTGKTGYFVQDQRGATKWLEAGVPDNLQFVPGGDYRAPQVFDKRTGALGPANAQVPPMSPSGAQLQSVGEMPPTQVDDMAPWAKITSPKEQDAVKGRVYLADSKRLDDAREEIRKGRAIMADLERFGELNRKQATGGLQDRLVPYYFDEDKREMEAIQNRLGPAQRTPGSGASSDRDVRLFLSGIPSVTQEGPVNKNIRDQFEKQLNEVRAELAFKEKYLAEKGYLAGAEESFEASKKNGLDVSKLTQEQDAFLRQQDPQAYKNGVASFGAKAQATKPKTGDHLDGFMFLGGDPADPKRWKQVNK